MAVVVPVFNEQDTVATLSDQLRRVYEQRGWRGTLCFVDDGSTDDTWSAIVRLAESGTGASGSDRPESASDDPPRVVTNEALLECVPPRVVGIRLRRNYGKAAALRAGFDSVGEDADVVVTMDGDLQDDPEELPRLIQELDAGFDVVSGWKRVRHDPWHKRWPSKAFNALVSRLTGVVLDDHNCGLKVYRPHVLPDLDLYGQRQRFLPVLAAAAGHRIGQLEVRHHPRRHGRSKYGPSRLITGTLDLLTIVLLTGYRGRPLHLIGTAGLAALTIGGAFLAYLTFLWIYTRLGGNGPPVHLHQTAMLHYAILFIVVGCQCLLTGLLAEVIVGHSTNRRGVYGVRQRVGQRPEMTGD